MNWLDLGKQAGVQGPVNPESFFGPNGFDMEKNDNGDYVYNANGTDITIPAATADRLQDQYNSSLPTPAEEAPTGQGVKYIPVQAVQQANQTFNNLTGTKVVDPAQRYLTSQLLNRQAGEALQTAPGGSGGTNATTPSQPYQPPKEVGPLTLPAVGSYPAGSDSCYYPESHHGSFRYSNSRCSNDSGCSSSSRFWAKLIGRN